MFLNVDICLSGLFLRNPGKIAHQTFVIAGLVVSNAGLLLSFNPHALLRYTLLQLFRCYNSLFKQQQLMFLTLACSSSCIFVSKSPLSIIITIVIILRFFLHFRMVGSRIAMKIVVFIRFLLQYHIFVIICA